MTEYNWNVEPKAGSRVRIDSWKSWVVLEDSDYQIPTVPTQHRVETPNTRMSLLVHVEVTGRKLQRINGEDVIRVAIWVHMDESCVASSKLGGWIALEDGNFNAEAK